MVQEVESAQAEPEQEPQPLTMKALLEAGAHFGHPTRRWHPRMKPYIFTERNGIHIIDLQRTLNLLDQAYNFVTELVAGGGTVLFVGTKKQAQESLVIEAQRCHMPYVNQRWLGGTLTNLNIIMSRIEYMKELEKQEEEGMFTVLPKKEALKLGEKLARLRKYFNGIREMEGLPDAIFIIDVVKERIAAWACQ
jgi:small subunit ribosomal protein S2